MNDDDLIQPLIDDMFHYICEFPNQSPEFYRKKFGLGEREFAKIIRWLGKQAMVEYNPTTKTIGVGFNG